jgi:hypothetical protein
VTAIPRRPAWRDSDPHWRRRILAGLWIMVLLPLMDLLHAFGWDSRVPVPDVFGYGVVHTLDQTLLCDPIDRVYTLLVFCIGVVLLFSKERGRRRGRFDWTRRWGVLCSYIVSLLSAAGVLFIGALVLVGIAAIFLSIAIKFQPSWPVTRLYVQLSTGYLWYGPFPHNNAGVVLVVFSSITVVLACFPLFDALRSSGPKLLAPILIAPLAFFSAMHVAQAARYWLGISTLTPRDLAELEVYFEPHVLMQYVADLRVADLMDWQFVEEAAKWGIIFAMAVWLTIAQIAASRQRRDEKTKSTSVLSK